MMTSSEPNMTYEQKIKLAYSTTKLSDNVIDRYLKKNLSNHEAEQFRQVFDRRAPQVHEERFEYDSNLFRIARMLQSLTVFKVLLSNDNANSIINGILSKLNFSHLIPISPRDNFDDKKQAVMDLHDQLEDSLKHALTIDGKLGMPLNDFYSIGQAELLYRHRYSADKSKPTKTGIREADGHIDTICDMLRQNVFIDGLYNLETNQLIHPGRFEEGKPGLANEVTNPEQNQYSFCEHTHEGNTVLHITRIEKFHPYETSDIEHTTLSQANLAEYLFIYDNVELCAEFNVKVKDDIEQPFWFKDLPRLRKYYLVADLQRMAQEAQTTDSSNILTNFKKRIDEKYSNTTAKERQLPGLSSIRRKTDILYKKNSDGNFVEVTRKEPKKNHFTSAGNPVHLRSKSKILAPKTGEVVIHNQQIKFAASNIASMLPQILEQRMEWMEKTFGIDFSSSSEKIPVTAFLIGSSLLSPFKLQAGVFELIGNFISPDKQQTLRENNEEMIVKTLKKAYEYLSNLMAEGKLDQLNSQLTSGIFKNVKYKFIFDLAIQGVNKFSKVNALRANKTVYATGPTSAFHALANDCDMFLTYWDKFLAKQDVKQYHTVYANQLKTNIQTLYNALVEISLQAQSRSLDAVDATKLTQQSNQLRLSIESARQCRVDDKACDILDALAERVSFACSYLGIRQGTYSKLETSRREHAKPIIKDNKNILLTATFELFVDFLLTACKSYHDRGEHNAAAAEAIKTTKQLLGTQPDPCNPDHYVVIIKVLIKEKFISESLMRARDLSTNAYGLKSHDSLNLNNVAVWAQELIKQFAEESNIIKDKFGSLDDSKLKKTEKTALVNELYFQLGINRMQKKFKHEAKRGDFGRKGHNFSKEDSFSDADDILESSSHTITPTTSTHNPMLSPTSNSGESVKRTTLDSYKNAPTNAQDIIRINLATIRIPSPAECEPTDYQLLRRNVQAIINYHHIDSLQWLRWSASAAVSTTIVFACYYALLDQNTAPYIISKIPDLILLSLAPVIVYNWTQITERLIKTGQFNEARTALIQMSLTIPYENKTLIKSDEILKCIEKEMLCPRDSVKGIIDTYFQGWVNPGEKPSAFSQSNLALWTQSNHTMQISAFLLFATTCYATGVLSEVIDTLITTATDKAETTTDKLLHGAMAATLILWAIYAASTYFAINRRTTDSLNLATQSYGDDALCTAEAYSSQGPVSTMAGEQQHLLSDSLDLEQGNQETNLRPDDKILLPNGTAFTTMLTRSYASRRTFSEEVSNNSLINNV